MKQAWRGYVLLLSEYADKVVKEIRIYFDENRFYRRVIIYWQAGFVGEKFGLQIMMTANRSVVSA